MEIIKGKIIMDNDEEMEFELYPEIAPITVENFVNLVKKGFYNGLTFHRVIPGIVIQGGSPLGNGTGGPGHTIKGDFNHEDWSQLLQLFQIHEANGMRSEGDLLSCQGHWL